MLKKTITYKDLDGNDVTEDFYFNLSKAEIAEMELTHQGGFSVYLQQIIESNDGSEIIKTFKNILKAAYGRRSEDGKRFIKSDEITEEFLQTDAYSVLFMELVTDGDAAAKFIESIVPADMSELIAEGKPMTELKFPEEPKDDRPAWIREDREPTKAEMQEMSKDELLEVFKRKQEKNEQ